MHKAPGSSLIVKKKKEKKKKLLEENQMNQGKNLEKQLNRTNSCWF